MEEDSFDAREAYAAQDEVARNAGWDDPALDVYNEDTLSDTQE